MVKQGDVIWLDFDPQLGHEQKGRRPALVVSNVVDIINGFIEIEKK
jgi:mRNA-degrading endonuclease toxin of MazEF toxin-antitoxin module